MLNLIRVFLSCGIFVLWCSVEAWAQPLEGNSSHHPGLLDSPSWFSPEAEEVATVNLPNFAPSGMQQPQHPPLMFEENLGQHHSEVKFLSRGPGYHAFFTETEMVMVLPGVSLPQQPGLEADHSVPSLQDIVTGEPAVLRMGFSGVRPGISVQGEDQVRARVNYFIGNHPNRWKTNVSNFARIRYRGIYPGVDLVFYGNAEGTLEYDFVVAPGADPSVISLRFEGADDMELTPEGDLSLHLGKRELGWRKPRILQEIAGVQVEVRGHYAVQPPGGVSGERRVVFEIQDYNPTLAMVIDPVLIYSTFLGGSRPYGDDGRGVDTDEEGNAYVTGTTQAVDFPTKNPFQGSLARPSGALPDVFVTKFDGSGQIVYSTYVGGDSVEELYGRIRVDVEGNVFVAGHTISTNFPTHNAIQPQFAGEIDDQNNARDCFAFKLSPDGSALIYSTYFGGTGVDHVSAIAIDSGGNLYVSGSTDSWDFPTTQGAFQPNLAGGGGDAFLFKLSPDGQQLIYSTYLGGTDSEGVAWGDGLAVDKSGRAYLVGGTSSLDFPTVDAMQPESGGASDGFLTIISPDGGSLLLSTYLGGSGNFDSIYGVLLGSEGDLYLNIQSTSPGFPPNSLSLSGTSTRTFNRFNPWTRSFLYSTYFWGGGIGNITSYALDQEGNLYVTGTAISGPTNFPLVDPLHGYGAGENDAFVSVLSADGTRLLFSTFLGGGGSTSQYTGGAGIAVDKTENIHLVGLTESPNFPVVDPFQPRLGGDRDAFYAKISPIAIANPTRLRVLQSNGVILISWPNSVTNGVLESAQVLPDGPWSTVESSPILIGNELVVTIEPKPGGEFFRLRQ